MFTEVKGKDQQEVFLMNDTSTNNWGPFGIISVVIGIASWLVGGMLSLGIGIVAVALGFFGIKSHQKVSQTGMIFGAISVLFVNLMNLGIVPIPSSLESDKSHLIKSINASIWAFNVLKNKKLEDHEREKLISHCRDALKEARMIDIDEVDSQVPGFADHYRKEFIGGMKLLIEGYDNSDFSKKFKGGLLLDKWAIWNRENNKSLGKIKEPTLSLISFLRGLIAG